MELSAVLNRNRIIDSVTYWNLRTNVQKYKILNSIRNLLRIRTKMDSFSYNIRIKTRFEPFSVRNGNIIRRLVCCMCVCFFFLIFLIFQVCRKYFKMCTFKNWWNELKKKASTNITIGQGSLEKYMILTDCTDYITLSYNYFKKKLQLKICIYSKIA